MMVLGVDPGLDGALAWQRIDGGAVVDYGAIDTPIKIHKNTKGRVQRAYDLPKMRDTLIDLVLDHGEEVRAVLEWIHAGVWSGEGRAQGASTAYSMGYGVAVWEALFTAFYVPYELVTPVVWKRAMLTVGNYDKDATRLQAQKLWPRVGLSLVKHNGRGDALFICKYGVRRVLSN